MKKRAIVASLQGTQQQVEALLLTVNEAKAKLGQTDDVANKLAWLHERVDLLATRLENMRGNVTLDDAAAQRLTYQVGQFAARLDRLEAPKPPRMPRKRPQKPAGPNGGA